jgi:hypothetical protein
MPAGQRHGERVGKDPLSRPGDCGSQGMSTSNHNMPPLRQLGPDLLRIPPWRRLLTLALPLLFRVGGAHRPDAGDRPLAGPTIRIMGIMDLGLMILMVFVATSYRTSLKTHGYHHGDHGSEAQGHARHLQRQQGHGPIRSNGRASFFPGNGSPGQLHQFCASTSLPRPTILVGVDPGGLTHDWRFPDHGVSAPAFVG